MKMLLFELCVVLLLSTFVSSETCQEYSDRLRVEASKYHIMDRFIPSCKEDGSYKEKQCYNAFSIKCWCVDAQGKKIEGSDKDHMDFECEGEVLGEPQKDEPAPKTCTDREGKIHEAGSRWQTKDPCTSCQCMDGQPLCLSAMCAPPPPCKDGQTPKQKEGTCCEFHPCPPQPTRTPPACSDQRSGKVYGEGEKWAPDVCTNCQCEGGRSQCAVMACVKPNCEGAILKSGTCCDFICPSEKQCVDEGVAHREGSTWNKDDCTTCQCLEGRSACYSFDCPRPRLCKDGSRPVKVEGECCPKCPFRGEPGKRPHHESKVPIRGKIVLPDTGIYTHIPPGSCAYVSVQEEIMDSATDYLAEKYIQVEMNGHEIEYELFVEKETLKMGQHYLLSATVNLGWCPTNDTTGDWIRDGDYFNDVIHCLIPKPGKPNRMNIKVRAHGKSLCGEHRCFPTEKCQMGEHHGAYCACPVRIGCHERVDDHWFCASDGNSYPSECAMKVADCGSDTLEKKHDGKCKQHGKADHHQAPWKNGMSVRVAMALGTAVFVTVVVVVVMLLCRKKIKVQDDFKKTKLVNQLSVVKDVEAEPIPEKVVPIPEKVAVVSEKIAEIIAAKNAPQDNFNPYA